MEPVLSGHPSSLSMSLTVPLFPYIVRRVSWVWYAHVDATTSWLGHSFTVTLNGCVSVYTGPVTAAQPIRPNHIRYPKHCCNFLSG